MDGFEPKRASISEVICPPSLNLMERVHSCRSDVDSKRLRLGRDLALEDTKGSREGWEFYISDKRAWSESVWREKMLKTQNPKIPKEV